MASGLRHLLECNVCSNSFNAKERVPKGLPCQHTFCLACLKRLKTHGFHTGDDGSVSIRVLVKCPECGQRFLAPSENVSNFPNNLTMISLLGAVKQTTALRPSADSDLKSCLSDRVQRLRDEISESAESLVSHLSNLDKQVKVAKASIANTFDRIRDAIDRRERYLVGELDDFMGRKESVVKHPTEGMAKQLQEMEKFCNEMDKRVKMKRESRIPTYIDHCLELIEHLENEKQQTKWEANFQVTTLDAIRASISQIGKLELSSPDSDYSDDEDEQHRHSSQQRRHSSDSSRGGNSRRRHRDSSVDTRSMSPTSSEATGEYNADEPDGYSPWSPILSNSGSYTDETPDDSVVSISSKYRREKKDIYRDQPDSPKRRRRITAIQSSFEFEQKYGGLVPLAEPPRRLAICPPTRHSTASYARLSGQPRSSAMSRTISNITRSEYDDLDYSHDSVDYEVPDFPPLPGTANVDTPDKLPVIPLPKHLQPKYEDKDEIYSQPFDSEDLLTDDGEGDEGEYVGAGLAWPPIPRNDDAGILPVGFELLSKPYLQRGDTITSVDTDSYVDMDAYHPIENFNGTKSDESMDTDPLEVLENLPGMPSDGEFTPRHSVKEHSKSNRRRNRSSNSNTGSDLKEAKEKLTRSPAARRKAFVESHQGDHQKTAKQVNPTAAKNMTPTAAKNVTPTAAKNVTPTGAKHATLTATKHVNPTATKHVTPTQSIYEDVTMMATTALQNENSLKARLKHAANDSMNDSEMSEVETERSPLRNVSRTVSVELPDISSLSFGKNNSIEDPPVELPPIADTPVINLPNIVGKPIVVVDNVPQDSAVIGMRSRPSSWSPLPNSMTHRMNVNGAIYTTVRRSSWSPSSDKELAFAELERSLSLSEWSDTSSSDEEDPYEIMSWSMPCGIDRIENLSTDNTLTPEIKSNDKLSRIPKRKSHPLTRGTETCTSNDDLLAQPRPRSYALCRQDRLRQSTDRGESIYWFPPRKLSRRRNSRRIMKLTGVSTGDSMEGHGEFSRSRVPPRVPKKPLTANP